MNMTRDTSGDPGFDGRADDADAREVDEADLPDTTDENDRPVDNPSG